MTTAALLAADDAGKAGPLGLLIVVLLGVAVVFLARSMQKHLRRVPERFEDKRLTDRRLTENRLTDRDDADKADGADSGR